MILYKRKRGEQKLASFFDDMTEALEPILNQLMELLFIKNKL